MKCPFCGGKMETCYLASTGCYLFLMRKPHPIRGYAFAPEEDKIAQLNMAPSASGIPVRICPTCRKVIFSYSDE